CFGARRSAVLAQLARPNQRREPSTRTSPAGAVAAMLCPLVGTQQGLTAADLNTVVYRYIGVSGGYVGEFTRSSHAEFYPVYCGFSVDTDQYSGTTRERFMAIVRALPPNQQAMVLRGLWNVCPTATRITKTRCGESSITLNVGRSCPRLPRAWPAR